MKGIIKYIKHILFFNLNKELHRNLECRGAERSALWPPAPICGPSPFSPHPSSFPPHPCRHQPTHSNSACTPSKQPPLAIPQAPGTHTGYRSAHGSLGGRTEQILRRKQAWDDRKFQNPGSSRCGLEREVIGSGWALAHDVGGR